VVTKVLSAAPRRRLLQTPESRSPLDLAVVGHTVHRMQVQQTGVSSMSRSAAVQMSRTRRPCLHLCLHPSPRGHFRLHLLPSGAPAVSHDPAGDPHQRNSDPVSESESEAMRGLLLRYDAHPVSRHDRALAWCPPPRSRDWEWEWTWAQRQRQELVKAGGAYERNLVRLRTSGRVP